MMIEGILRGTSSFNIASKPVESVNNIREATQNQTRTEKTRKLVNPSNVTINMNKPELALKTVVPGVRNRDGTEMTAAKSGIKIVRVIKSFNRNLEAIARITGMIHNSNKWGNQYRKSETPIMDIVTTNLTTGFIDCRKPFCPLKSSM